MFQRQSHSVGGWEDDRIVSSEEHQLSRQPHHHVLQSIPQTNSEVSHQSANPVQSSATTSINDANDLLLFHRRASTTQNPQSDQTRSHSAYANDSQGSHQSHHSTGHYYHYQQHQQQHQFRESKPTDDSDSDSFASTSSTSTPSSLLNHTDLDVTSERRGSLGSLTSNSRRASSDSLSTTTTLHVDVHNRRLSRILIPPVGADLMTGVGSPQLIQGSSFAPSAASSGVPPSPIRTLPSPRVGLPSLITTKLPSISSLHQLSLSSPAPPSATGVHSPSVLLPPPLSSVSHPSDILGLRRGSLQLPAPRRTCSGTIVSHDPTAGQVDGLPSYANSASNGSFPSVASYSTGEPFSTLAPFERRHSFADPSGMGHLKRKDSIPSISDALAENPAKRRGSIVDLRAPTTPCTPSSPALGAGAVGSPLTSPATSVPPSSSMRHFAFPRINEDAGKGKTLLRAVSVGSIKSIGGASPASTAFPPHPPFAGFFAPSGPSAATMANLGQHRFSSGETPPPFSFIGEDVGAMPLPDSAQSVQNAEVLSSSDNKATDVGEGDNVSVSPPGTAKRASRRQRYRARGTFPGHVVTSRADYIGANGGVLQANEQPQVSSNTSAILGTSSISTDGADFTGYASSLHIQYGTQHSPLLQSASSTTAHPQFTDSASSLSATDSNEGVSRAASVNDKNGVHSTVSGESSSIPAPTMLSPYARTPELRVSHKMAERKRRKEIKDLFDELKDSLPQEAFKGGKASKWEVLSTAVEHIEMLHSIARERDALLLEVELLRSGRAVDSQSSHALPSGSNMVTGSGPASSSSQRTGK